MKVSQWLPSLEGVTEESSILDLGCGNGYTLIDLVSNSNCVIQANEGFKHLTGVDYSVTGIELAKGIATKEGVTISYLVDNVLDTKLTDRYQVQLLSFSERLFWTKEPSMPSR